MQLVSTVATDLKLPTRVSPPYSHQSQGKVERFHRNLFDQLRTTRLQWSRDLNIEPHMLPPESLPWALHHSIFILHNYLVHSSGKTSHFENYRYNYRSNIMHFGVIVLGDVRNSPTQKLRLRNQHQKLRGIWLGRDLITNERILALPLHYSQHPSTLILQHLLEHTGAGRSLVYLVKNNMTSSSWRASTGLSSVMTSTSTSRSTSTTFRSRTSQQEIYNCNNHQRRRTLNNLRVFNLQLYDIILKQLRHLKNNSLKCYNHLQDYLNHLYFNHLDRSW